MLLHHYLLLLQPREVAAPPSPPVAGGAAMRRRPRDLAQPRPAWVPGAALPLPVPLEEDEALLLSGALG